MANKERANNAQFNKKRVKDLLEMYSGQEALNKKLDRTSRGFAASVELSAADIRQKLNDAVNNSNNLDSVVQLSRNAYASNPMYMALISYYADMFMWRYVVTPHELMRKKFPVKEVSNFRIEKNDYNLIYNAMIEIAEGINLECKAPLILKYLFLDGSVYFITTTDETSLTIDTILLPPKYCRKIAETQFGTGIIQFDIRYFDGLGLTTDELNKVLAMFPPEVSQAYLTYKQSSDKTQKVWWVDLDPHYSSCLMLNDKGLPTLVYTLGSILNYEKYGDNELARNENLLKYIVVHKMPLYQDTLIFETDEVAALHKSLSKIVNTSDKTRLITTYGDVSIEKIQDTENTENKVLENAFSSIFNNAGLNASIFTGESVQSLKYSLLRDKAQVWTFIQQLEVFYNMTINSWFDFGNYQMDIEVLPISQYSLEDDIKRYRDNATLGIGKIDFIVASGVKQSHIADRFKLEKFLKLEEITPLQTSYTQTSVDRQQSSQDKDKENPKSSDDNSDDNTPSPDVSEQDEVKGQEDKNEKD